MWTEQQENAMMAKDSDILVAAAAGSGKTAVLVERIIRRITEGDAPMDIDRMLVVTFTKAAAAEMSQRIGAAITKKLEQDPQNVHLQNQLAYLSHADIKTIHAFCLQVIREYYDLLDLDPAAKTADPSEIKLLQRDVLEDLFEELYEQEDTGFLQLLETFSEDTGDKRLKDLILQVYEFAQGDPHPQRLLLDMAERFAFQEDESLDDCVWMECIQTAVSGNVADAQYQMQKAERLTKYDAEFTAYHDCIVQELEPLTNLKHVLEEKGYANWQKAFAAVSFGRMPAYRGEEKEKAEQIKNLRNDAKTTIQKLGETYFCYDAEMQLRLLKGLYPVAKALSDVTILFMERFAEAKKEKLWLDFHDYEHFALQILTKPESTKDNVIPTEAAKQMQKKYDEVMIDEYQDSNVVQEMLLCAVSGAYFGENNRFMVGDVKQSIYRFRLAMPQLFNEKYRTYPVKTGGKTRKIILSKNFRSRKNVLDGINFLFHQLMTEDCGDVAYDAEAALYAGAEFPPFAGVCGGDCEMVVLETATNEEELPEELEELDKKQLEITWILHKIKEMQAEDFSVLDKETGAYRPLEYRDVAILLRSIKSWGNTLDDVFGKEGVPYYAETAEGYYDMTEVDTILNMLRLTDNPYQDIPLLSLLYSPIYALSADDLAQIRLFGGDGLFYECVLYYEAEGEEESIVAILSRFIADLQDWREKARQISLHELLRYLYQQTGYYDYVGMTAGGSLRQANLRLLLEKAETYENSSQKGLFHFVRYVEQMKTTEAEASAAKLQSEAENLVHVMTIHKSKGLEFPVVFVADMGKQFNEADIRSAVITHQSLGYGMDYMDLEQRAQYRTLSKTALAEVIRLENISEEMRVLYVALTRAKEKLILTGTVRSLEKAIAKWAEIADCGTEQLPVYRVRKSRNYLDWVMPALLRHPVGRVLPEPWEPVERGEPYFFLEEPSKWQILLLQKIDVYNLEKQKMEKAKQKIDLFSNWDTEQDYSGNKEQIFQILSWQYDHKTATKLPAKVSISEIKRKYAEIISGEPAPVPAELKLPDFVKEKRAVTGAAIGTAMHTVVEALDLQQTYATETLQTLINQLTEQSKMAKEEAELIPKQEILQFLQSDLAERMRKAEILKKEQPFAMLMRPKDVFLDGQYDDVDEWIQINGIIDCYFIEQDGVVLVDYKSDRLRSKKLFKEKYGIQLQLYKEALQRVTGLQVKECLVYAFAMGQTIIF